MKKHRVIAAAITAVALLICFNFLIGWRQDVSGKLEHAQNLQLEVNEARKHPIRQQFSKDSKQYRALLEWAKNNDWGWRWDFLFFIEGVPYMVIHTPGERTLRLEITPYGKALLGVDLQEFYKSISQEDYDFLRKEVFGDPPPEASSSMSIGPQ